MNITLEGEITVSTFKWSSTGHVTMDYQMYPRLNPGMVQSLTLSGTLPPHFQDRIRYIFEEWLQGQLVAAKMTT